MAPKRFKPKSKSTKPTGIVQKIAKTTLGDIWKQVSYLKNIINVEFKYKDTASSGAISNTGTVVYLSSIDEGNEYNQRSGRSVRCYSIFAKFRLVVNASATTGTIVRIMIVQDNSNRQADPAVTDILLTAAVESSINTVTSPKRFNVLMDRMVNLSPSGDASKIFEKYIENHSHQRYVGTGTTSASAGDGALYLVMLSTESTNTPTVVWNIRYKYVDN